MIAGFLCAAFVSSRLRGKKLYLATRHKDTIKHKVRRENVCYYCFFGVSFTGAVLLAAGGLGVTPIFFNTRSDMSNFSSE